MGPDKILACESSLGPNHNGPQNSKLILYKVEKPSPPNGTTSPKNLSYSNLNRKFHESNTTHVEVNVDPSQFSPNSSPHSQGLFAMEIMTDKKGELCPNCSLSSDNSQNRGEKPIPNNNTVIFPIQEK